MHKIILLFRFTLGLPPGIKREPLMTHYKKNGIIVQNITRGNITFFDDLLEQEIFYKLESPHLDSLPAAPICRGIAGLHEASDNEKQAYKEFIYEEISKIFGSHKSMRKLTRRSADLQLPFNPIMDQTTPVLTTTVNSNTTTPDEVIIVENFTTGHFASTAVTTTPPFEKTTQLAFDPSTFSHEKKFKYLNEHFRISSTKNRYKLNMEWNKQAYVYTLKPEPVFQCEKNHLYIQLRVRSPNPFKNITIYMGKPANVSPKLSFLTGPNEMDYWAASNKEVKILLSDCNTTEYQNMINDTIINFSCNKTDETAPQELKLSMSFNNEQDCLETSFKQIEVSLWELGNDVEAPSRKRRQIMLGALGSMLVGAIGTHYVERKLQNKEIHENQILLQEEQEEILKLSGMLNIVNNETHQLQKQYLQELCSVNLEERQLNLKMVAENLANIFVDRVNIILFGLNLPNSKLKTLASNICKKENEANNAKECWKFFENKKYTPEITNFGIASREHFEETGNSFIWITAKFQIPKLSRHEGSIHKLVSIPIPIGQQDDKFLYKTYEVPKAMAYLDAPERKFNTKDCEPEIYDTTFCKLTSYNEISNSDNLCINSLFNDDPQCFEQTVISSSNCLFRKIEHALYISHQGSAASINNPKKFQKNQIYYNKGKNLITKSGIFYFNFSDPVSISCQDNEFHFKPHSKENFSVIDYDALGNDSIPNFLSSDIPLMNRQLSDLGKNSNKMTKLFNRFAQIEKNTTHHMFFTDNFSIYTVVSSIVIFLNLMVSIHYMWNSCLHKIRSCKRRWFSKNKKSATEMKGAGQSKDDKKNHTTTVSIPTGQENQGFDG